MTAVIIAGGTMDVFSMAITIPNEMPTVRKIGISGPMTIHHADEIKSVMLETLTEADEVSMEMEHITEIDLVGMQLLCSAHQTSFFMNKRFRLNGSCTDSVTETILDSGFKRHVGCDKADHICLWVGGGK